MTSTDRVSRMVCLVVRVDRAAMVSSDVLGDGESMKEEAVVTDVSVVLGSTLFSWPACVARGGFCECCGAYNGGTVLRCTSLVAAVGTLRVTSSALGFV